jgi:uncharacterized BrkB/YihY/UPF0761 family membrane protein
MGKEVPTLVKVIAVLSYILSVGLLIFGILAIVAAAYVGALLGSFEGSLGFLGGAIFVVLGIIMIAFAVLYFFIGRGLWKGQPWARIVAIILLALGVIFALIGMIGGEVTENIFSLVINGLVGGYLLFSKDVKEAFS